MVCGGGRSAFRCARLSANKTNPPRNATQHNATQRNTTQLTPLNAPRLARRRRSLILHPDDSSDDQNTIINLSYSTCSQLIQTYASNKFLSNSVDEAVEILATLTPNSPALSSYRRVCKAMELGYVPGYPTEVALVSRWDLESIIRR